MNNGKICKWFSSDDKRTSKIKKNVVASIVFKGVDILVYLVLVPLTLGYLDAYEYGIWLTLNSILLWINSFDIGLGNGLRNKLAIAVAKGDYTLGRIYVSTTFYSLIIIMLFLFAITYFCCISIDWYSVLNVNEDSIPGLEKVVIYSFACFCLNFVFKFVGNVYLALQMPAITNFLNVLGHVFSLLFIWILTKVTDGSLLYVAVVYSISPVLVYMLAYPITFYVRYRILAPSFSLVRFSYLKDLMGIGLQFFFLQIAGIILFASSNLVMSHMLGPESVTPYNIAYRYFSVIPLGYTILISPMWSAVTDAYVKGDIEWIKKSMRKMRTLLLCTAVIIVLMIIFSDFVYRIWVGGAIEIPWKLSLCMGIYIYVLVWSLSYSHFLNGIGKLRIQVLNTFVVAILFYPLAILLVEYWKGVGMVSVMILVNLSGALLNTIQFNKIVNKTDEGLWAR
ncbi:oligosaccharide flippase family protein [Bacteroides sp.]|uniref:lipopolysaccharide biosynthesis protein n=1 Tax=Bacteroides sp. TaxID=29523 RepID=UPI0025BB19EA|nr:oligosaccharide flippase family protein [Bacteroides sp.]